MIQPPKHAESSEPSYITMYAIMFAKPYICTIFVHVLFTIFGVSVHCIIPNPNMCIECVYTVNLLLLSTWFDSSTLHVHVTNLILSIFQTRWGGSVFKQFLTHSWLNLNDFYDHINSEKAHVNITIMLKSLKIRQTNNVLISKEELLTPWLSICL